MSVKNLTEGLLDLTHNINMRSKSDKTDTEKQPAYRNLKKNSCTVCEIIASGEKESMTGTMILHVTPDFANTHGQQPTNRSTPVIHFPSSQVDKKQVQKN